MNSVYMHTIKYSTYYVLIKYRMYSNCANMIIMVAYTISYALFVFVVCTEENKGQTANYQPINRCVVIYMYMYNYYTLTVISKL